MMNGGATTMRRRGRVAMVASTLLMTTALVSATGMMPAFAQSASSSGMAASHSFDIGAQPMTSALTLFGVQSGLQVTVDGAILRNITAPAVNGTLTGEQALTQLLAGSGLSYDLAADNTVVIIALAGADNADTTTLDPVRIVADGERSTDPNTAITDSFIAPRSLTASKTDTPVLDDSAAVSIITQKEMETRHVQRVAEALGYTSGVTVDEYGSDERSDFVRIRGFYQSTLGYYRDGLPTRVYNFTNSRMEPYGLQQIDVLKGSTSSLFGLNGPGGLVNAITKRPQDKAHAEVFTTFGEDHLTTGGDVGGPVGEDGKWSYRLTGLWQDAENSQDYSQDDRLYIAPAFTFKPKAGTELTILTNYSKRESTPGYGFPRGVDIDPDTFLGEPGFHTFDTEDSKIGYQFSHELSDNLTFRQNAQYNHVDLDYEQIYASDPSTSRTAFAIYGDLDRFSIDNQMQYDTSWNRFDSKSLFGFDYSHDQNRERRYDGTAPGINIYNPTYCGVSCVNVSFTSDTEITQSSYGLYAQEQLTIDDKWIATLGGRYDYVQSDIKTKTPTANTLEENNEQAFTSRAGLTYKVTDGLSVYGNYSESFQPVYSNVSNISGSVKPQEGTQYEVGLKYQPANFDALFTAAVFDLTQTNVPSYISATERVQIGEVNSRGLELEGKVSLTDRWNATVSYTYLDAEIKDDATAANIGKRPASVPKNVASAWMDYTIPGQNNIGDLTVGAGIRYVGSTYADSGNTLPMSAYAVTDAMVKYMITDHLSFAVNATNLFDREYVAYSYSADYYGQGRTVLGTLKYTW
ncbi:TonB-dependent siderophore receptor [Thalassospira marina]|uniref:TonB-dependent siderophore receptor n=1 Tax=Thalassospira marina TaxID=2048283 RepID=A0A2N3KM60_9PROT|nr:TonB-dependent siderophore receptor [Thalassospira marina]PKR51659.1 TonB-dependent siderophore receptor [Thalassospira marina]